MVAALTRVVEEIAPPHSAEQRRATREVVERLLSDTEHVTLRLADGAEYQLDAEETRALLAIAAARAEGRHISVVSHTEMLTPQQAAELLGVSRPMVYRFIERGDLHGTRVGSHWRIPTTDVLALANKRADLIEDVGTRLDAVAQASVSRDGAAAARINAKEAWRASSPEQREESLERVRRRAGERRE